MSSMIDGSRHTGNVSKSRPGLAASSASSLVATVALLALLVPGRPVRADFDSFRPFLPLQVSTVPSNGDLNPYGLAFVPADFPFGDGLKPGQMLISNFNDTSLQGRGSTIITIDPRNGQTGLFFQGTPPIGFTNALGIVHAGLVFAGSVLTTDGTSNTAKSGGLYVLNGKGQIVANLGMQQLINGPWGLAINDRGPRAQLFVSNVFDGTITRLDVTFGNGSIAVQNAVKIGSGYGFGPDSAAVVVGPAGLAYDVLRDTLFVASEKDDTIFALHGAGSTQTDLGTGAVVYQDAMHLHGPLGLIFAPNGDLLVANADPGESGPQPTERDRRVHPERTVRAAILGRSQPGFRIRAGDREPRGHEGVRVRRRFPLHLHDPEPVSRNVLTLPSTLLAVWLIRVQTRRTSGCSPPAYLELHRPRGSNGAPEACSITVGGSTEWPPEFCAAFCGDH